jgi:hypothetical protein
LRCHGHGVQSPLQDWRCCRRCQKQAMGAVELEPDAEQLELVGACVGRIDLHTISTIPNLRRLMLRNCCVADFRQLTGLGALTHLEYSSSSASHAINQHLLGVGQLTGLKHLDIQLSSNGTVCLRGVQHLLHLTALRSLDLDLGNASANDNAELLALLAHLTSLRMRRAPPGNRIAPLAGLANLRTVWLATRGVGITASGAAALAALSALTKLRLDDSNVDNAALRGLAALTGLQVLPQLIFCNCRDMGRAGIARLVTLTHLRKLDLRASREVGDSAVVPLVSLTGLSFLGLRLTGISDVSLKSLAPLTALCELNIEDCPKVSDAGIACLTALCRLRMLSLTTGSRSRERAVGHLRACMPELVVRELQSSMHQ